MASDDRTDDATLQALLARLLEFRLPRALAIKEHVESGARLDDTQIEFLKGALDDAKNAQQFVVRNPEFHRVGARIVKLYEEIVGKAMENEKRG
ncbi:hypothetical protein LF41_322 [Lysobacter dokdonensis DS-58]|uniref:Uncharacterized protein n=1 Tax=Lysobacter dokdonensis DS-58 TaxID=1300345 RepID=A0A0A2X0P3_9GAMM|nr:hypothetical protein [Lysobacter dokdonensis]KGQ18789.1 hypothetical protein LF41_322 [Lysobacter dokdonensis DS-58]